MKRFKFLFCTALLINAFALQACQSSRGYNKTPWQYNSAQKEAAANPGNLSHDTQKRDNIDPMLDGAAPTQSPGQAPKIQLPPVKVAILLPLSGKHAQLGEAMLNAAQMAIFEIGHQSFELVPRDTKGTASGAKTAAQDAVNNGAQLVLGPIFADSVRSAKPVTRNAGINMIGFSTDWSLADNSTFIMGFLPFDQVSRVIRYAATQGMENIGVFAPATNYGDAVLNAYNNVSYRAGVNTVAMKRFSSSNSSLSTSMRSFAQYDQRQASGDETPPPYDAIFIPTGGDQARTVASFASQYGMLPRQVKRLGTGLWDDESLASEPALDHGWFAAPSPKARKAFEQRYFQTYATSPKRLSTLAYDATALAAVLARNGLQMANRPAFDSISIQNPNGFAGIDGIFRFREGGLVERGLAILEYRNGAITILDHAPRSFQNRDM